MSLHAKGFNFIKMHGLGNDFVFLDRRRQDMALSPAFIRRLADRNRGVGCDQVIVMCPPTDPTAHVAMAIYNADGEKAQACGNGTRCLAALLTKESRRSKHVIETPRALVYAHVNGHQVTLDMGEPDITWASIPLANDVDTLFLPIHVPDLDRPVAVGMGNPHMVFFTNDLESLSLHRLGQELSVHPLFPQGTNVSFAQVSSPENVQVMVFERGAGITQSCGTAACATVVAGVRRGLLASHVTVGLQGGTLEISYDQRVTMSGDVSFVFEGQLYGNFGL